MGKVKGRFYAIGTLSGIIQKLKRTMFTHACVLFILPLQLFMFSSAEELHCSVSRVGAGDRIHFADYNGSCNKRVNPCQKIDGSELVYSRNSCTCQCKRPTTTYREDNRYCVANKINREGCTLLFIGEKDADNLRVFSNSSSIKLNTLPKETCEAKATYYITNEITEGWKELSDKAPAFFIHHQDRKKKRHAHFLRWNNDQPVAALFGKIVKVDVECATSKRRDVPKTPRSRLCIVFKVKGSISLPCLAGIPSTDVPTSDTITPVTTTVKTITPNKTRPSTETTQKPLTVITVTLEPNTTPSPSQQSNTDKGDSKSYIGEKVALPIWLIAVIAGGAVIATLAITAIIWICFKMKQRSRKRRKKRRKCGNPLYNNDDNDTVITFATSGEGPGVDEAGYARVGSPGRKGYAFLKPGPERTRLEYQRLVKPGEDHSGYLVPMEERTPRLPPTSVVLENPCTTDAAVYSEAANPPQQDKTKSKDYDYAKPEDFISLAASLSSLDKLDAHESETELGYVPAKEDSESNDVPPSSPFYATVEGPSSPGLPTEGAVQDLPPEDTPSENNSASDTKNEYVELLPDTGAESGNSLVKKKDSVA